MLTQIHHRIIDHFFHYARQNIENDIREAIDGNVSRTSERFKESYSSIQECDGVRFAWSGRKVSANNVIHEYVIPMGRYSPDNGSLVISDNDCRMLAEKLKNRMEVPDTYLNQTSYILIFREDIINEATCFSVRCFLVLRSSESEKINNLLDKAIINKHNNIPRVAPADYTPPQRETKPQQENTSSHSDIYNQYEDKTPWQHVIDFFCNR